MGMVALVLVIACVNIAMLLAARNAAREREFSMRLALGAGRWPLFRQLFAESLLLVGAGAVLGWFFAVEATKLLALWSEIEVSLEPDTPVLLFTLALSVLAAVVFGLAPLRAANNAPVALVLKSTGGQSAYGEPQPDIHGKSPDRGADGRLRGAAVRRGAADSHIAQLSERRPGHAGGSRAGLRGPSGGRRR